MATTGNAQTYRAIGTASPGYAPAHQAANLGESDTRRCRKGKERKGKGKERDEEGKEGKGREGKGRDRKGKDKQRI